MAEYIEKENALMQLTGINLPEDTCSYIGIVDRRIYNLPPADVVPVIHAKWERAGCSSLIDRYRCSNCHSEPCKKQIEEYKTWGWDFTDYCPHCGAKMDLIKRSKVMTYGDKIRSMNDTELAEFLSSCVIPDDECELMFIYGIGYLGFADDLEKKLGEQIKE